MSPITPSINYSLTPSPIEFDFPLFEIGSKEEEVLLKQAFNKTNEKLLNALTKKDNLLRLRLCQAAYQVIPLEWFNKENLPKIIPKNLLEAFQINLVNVPQTMAYGFMGDLKIDDRTFDLKTAHYFFVHSLKFLDDFLIACPIPREILFAKKPICHFTACAIVLKVNRDISCEKFLYDVTSILSLMNNVFISDGFLRLRMAQSIYQVLPHEFFRKANRPREYIKDLIKAFLKEFGNIPLSLKAWFTEAVKDDLMNIWERERLFLHALNIFDNFLNTYPIPLPILIAKKPISHTVAIQDLLTRDPLCDENIACMQLSFALSLVNNTYADFQLLQKKILLMKAHIICDFVSKKKKADAEAKAKAEAKGKVKADPIENKGLDESNKTKKPTVGTEDVNDKTEIVRTIVKHRNLNPLLDSFVKQAIGSYETETIEMLIIEKRNKRTLTVQQIQDAYTMSQEYTSDIWIELGDMIFAYNEKLKKKNLLNLKKEIETFRKVSFEQGHLIGHKDVIETLTTMIKKSVFPHGSTLREQTVILLGEFKNRFLASVAQAGNVEEASNEMQNLARILTSAIANLNKLLKQKLKENPTLSLDEMVPFSLKCLSQSPFPPNDALAIAWETQLKKDGKENLARSLEKVLKGAQETLKSEITQCLTAAFMQSCSYDAWEYYKTYWFSPSLRAKEFSIWNIKSNTFELVTEQEGAIYDYAVEWEVVSVCIDGKENDFNKAFAAVKKSCLEKYPRYPFNEAFAKSKIAQILHTKSNFSKQKSS